MILPVALDFWRAPPEPDSVSRLDANWRMLARDCKIWGRRDAAFGATVLFAVDGSGWRGLRRVTIRKRFIWRAGCLALIAAAAQLAPNGIPLRYRPLS
jgi:hypothetical protein